MTTLLQLPTHIIISIFDYLTCMEDYIAIGSTCKRFMLVLKYHHLITRDKCEEFQKCRRELYQPLAKFIPKDGKWKLNHHMVSFIRKTFLTRTYEWEYTSSQMIDGRLQPIVREAAEQEHYRLHIACLFRELCDSSSYSLVGQDRATKIYDDVVYKLANNNFKVLDVSGVDEELILFGGLFNSIIRRQTGTLKLKKLVIRVANLMNLSYLHDNQDLFDDCYLYLQVCSNRLKHQTFRNTITGIARVFITGKGLGRKKAQRIFHDNRGQPAVICHKSKM